MVHVCSLSIVLLPSAHIQISDCFISPLFQAEYIAKKEAWTKHHFIVYAFSKYSQLLLEFKSVHKGIYLYIC